VTSVNTLAVLATADCAWRYGGKWAWLARRGRSTASNCAQRAVRVDCGLLYTTVSAIVACNVETTKASSRATCQSVMYSQISRQPTSNIYKCYFYHRVY